MIKLMIIMAVEFNHVTFTYEGAGASSLSDITFRAKKGQTIGIIGGTGSGKSTLVSLIPRFYDPQEGTVKVNGVNAKDYPQGELAVRSEWFSSVPSCSKEVSVII